MSSLVQGPPAPSRFNRGGYVESKGITPSKSVLSFAGGGVVPGPRVNRDIIPALLTPGEGVLNLLGMRTLGREGLDGLNSGRSAASSTTINVAVHVQGGGGGGGGGSGGTPDLAAVRRAAEMGVLDALRNKPGYRDQVRSLLK